MVKQIPINFNRKIIWFFIMLEGLTVPCVAMSNSFVIKNTYAMLVMGFIVALVAVFILLNILKKFIIKRSESLLGFKVEKIYHVWYIAIISGILEMVMFLVQDEMFSRGYGDWSAGFWSAFISVFISLLVYKIVLTVLRFSIKFYSNQAMWIINLRLLDIVRLSIIFGAYEFVVCPITGWWIPYSGLARFGMSVFSAVIGAFIGSVLVIVMNKIKLFQPQITISQINL